MSLRIPDKKLQSLVENEGTVDMFLPISFGARLAHEILELRVEVMRLREHPPFIVCDPATYRGEELQAELAGAHLALETATVEIEHLKELTRGQDVVISRLAIEKRDAMAELVDENGTLKAQIADQQKEISEYEKSTEAWVGETAKLRKDVLALREQLRDDSAGWVKTVEAVTASRNRLRECLMKVQRAVDDLDEEPEKP